MHQQSITASLCQTTQMAWRVLRMDDERISKTILRRKVEDTKKKIKTTLMSAIEDKT